jgi:hypothetical protein
LFLFAVVLCNCPREVRVGGKKKKREYYCALLLLSFPLDDVLVLNPPEQLPSQKGFSFCGNGSK